MRQEFGEEVMKVVEEIRPILAGKGPVMQMAVIGELTGTVLAGHWIPGDREETKRVRRELLSRHVALVWELCEATAKEMGTDK